jgi:tRNA pseudouridine55 synthase
MTFRNPKGFLVLDKPRGPTSRDIVNLVQRTLPRGTRVGHAGTLDPLATGVLVVAVGVATRFMTYIQAMPKTYHSLLRLGATSDTEDVDGRVDCVNVSQVPTRPVVLRCLQGFLGEIQQTPPAYSAARILGRRAYDLARQGQSVSLAPRNIKIHAIEIVRYDYPHLELEVRCGSGTYIRALARDIGRNLACGAIVEALRRTAIGSFVVEDALTAEAACKDVYHRLLPVTAALVDLDRFALSASQIEHFRLGQPIALPEPVKEVRELAVSDEAGALIGVGAFRNDGMLWPVKVLPIEE